jgi:hypothetical protein
VVAEAVQRPIEVSRSRSQLVALLYSTAVRSQVRLVRLRGLSFRSGARGLLSGGPRTGIVASSRSLSSASRPGMLILGYSPLAHSTRAESAALPPGDGACCAAKPRSLSLG